MPGHDGVAGSLTGEAGRDRRWNALFWSPLSLRICLSSAKNRVLRLSTGRNSGWSADPSNLDLRGSCYGEILNRAIPATLKLTFPGYPPFPCQVLLDLASLTSRRTPAVCGPATGGPTLRRAPKNAE